MFEESAQKGQISCLQGVRFRLLLEISVKERRLTKKDMNTTNKKIEKINNVILTGRRYFVIMSSE